MEPERNQKKFPKSIHLVLRPDLRFTKLSYFLLNFEFLDISLFMDLEPWQAESAVEIAEGTFAAVKAYEGRNTAVGAGGGNAAKDSV